MQSRITVWDPHGSSKFIVGSSSELRLMQWDYSKTTSTMQTLSTISELGQARAFQWSPSLSIPDDLIGVGLTSGKVLLLRANVNPSSTSNNTSHISISPRSSRPCNAVAFSFDKPYLAVGLEKGRGESLMVFDIEAHSRTITGSRPQSTNSLQIHSSSSPYPTSPIISSLPGSTSTTEPKPLLQFGSSESVFSAAFLAPSVSSTSLLVAGMGGKYIRAYDVRIPSNSIAVAWSTRSLYGIASNPFNSMQLSSHGEDGVVKLWDLRMTSDPLLSFSESDAGSLAARKSTLSSKPLIDVLWHPSRKGTIATLEKESSKIRVWSLLEGSIAKLESSLITVEGEELRLPTLIGDQTTRAYQHPLSAFAFARSSHSSPSSIHLLGVSRDTSNPGTSGHRLQLIDVLAPQHSKFLEKSLVISAEDSFSSIDITPLSMINNQEEEELAGRLLDRRDSKVSDTSILVRTGGRGRALSLSSFYVPATKSNLENTVSEEKRDRLEEVSLGNGGLGALARDPSVTLRDKVDCGYNSNPALNALLVDSASLREFWTWIERAEISSIDSCILEYDFRYRGVLEILRGFPKSSASSTSTDIHRSLRKGDEAPVKDPDYAVACDGLVSKRRLGGSFALSSTFIPQRKLAMEVCGRDWQESFEAVCLRYQRAEEFEACARFCFLNGNLEATIKNLKSCKEDSLRLLTPVLAAYISQKNASKGSDTVFSDLCRSLSSDVDIPWVRAMFAYLASGIWRDVVDESGLPLKERIAVALRFLSDHELIPFLQEIGNESMASGDLEAVLLFGLRSTGLELLQSYLNRTADIQTIAIAASFISPGLVRSDKRIERWIETYRSLLDRLRLYTTRALFDSARGRRGRVLLEQTKLAGRSVEASEVGKALRALAPPQILVRCQFCSSNLSIAGGEMNGMTVGTKTTSCTNCHKALPGCSVCLSKPSEGGGSTQIWCQNCRHGGHSNCLLSWFDRSDVCPVSNCDCNCTQDS